MFTCVVCLLFVLSMGVTLVSSLLFLLSRVGVLKAEYSYDDGLVAMVMNVLSCGVLGFCYAANKRLDASSTYVWLRTHS